MTLQVGAAQFVESRQAYGPRGEILAATDYVFACQEKHYSVRVTCEAVRTLDGQLSPEEVERAARAYLEECIEKEWLSPEGRVELNADSIERVALKLGWSRRFRKLL